MKFNLWILKNNGYAQFGAKYLLDDTNCIVIGFNRYLKAAVSAK